jgi:hypothetical protein
MIYLNAYLLILPNYGDIKNRRLSYSVFLA